MRINAKGESEVRRRRLKKRESVLRKVCVVCELGLHFYKMAQEPQGGDKTGRFRTKEIGDVKAAVHYLESQLA